MIREYLENINKRAVSLNQKNILDLISRYGKEESVRLCDLGCNDGEGSLLIGKKLKSGSSLYGVELDDPAVEACLRKGIVCKKADLNDGIPFDDYFFDIVHANQVIEHLNQFDFFLGEVRRVLKDEGFFIISTENLASWINIFSLILGFQPFSSTNVSRIKQSIGNPFSLHKNSDCAIRETWRHVEVFSYQFLKDLLEAHRFKILEICGAGYFPLPAILGRFDKRHAHFMTVASKKSSF